MDYVIGLLLFQGLLGGFDVMWNHEWKERLPSRPSAALEQKIHGVRELFYAVVFIGLAWYEWHGVWAWVFLAVLAVEILLTAWDFVVEDQTRRLSATERVTHLVLSMCGGAYVALLMPVLSEWSQQTSELTAADYGMRSWVLTAFGLGVLAWGWRDLASGLKLATRSRGALSLGACAGP